MCVRVSKNIHILMPEQRDSGKRFMLLIKNNMKIFLHSGSLITLVIMFPIGNKIRVMLLIFKICL